VVSLEFSGKKVYRKVEEIVSRRIADEMFIVPIRGRLADMKQISGSILTGNRTWRKSSMKLRQRMMSGDNRQKKTSRSLLRNSLRQGSLRRTSERYGMHIVRRTQ
jgi:hypothetical protein